MNISVNTLIGNESQEGSFQFRTACLANGYQPIAVYSARIGDPQSGKLPKGIGWQHSTGIPATTPDALNTGILTTGLQAIDIDIDDAERAKQVRELALQRLGSTIERTRSNSPRVLLVYRAAEGAPRKRLCLNSASGEKIEVLGAGQQFVAHGMHRSGATLEWANGMGPDIVPVTSLPAVTEEQIKTFLQEAGAIIGADRSFDANALNGSGDTMPLGTDSAPSRQQFLDMLAIIDPPSDYDDWFRLLFALMQAGWNHFDDKSELQAILREWCKRDPDKFEEPAFLTKWNDAIKNGTHAGWSTLQKVASIEDSAAYAMMLFGGQPIELPPGASPEPIAKPAPATTADSVDDLLAYVSEEHNKAKLSAFVKRFARDIPVAYDEFAKIITVTGSLPWDRSFPRQWTENDNRHMQLAAEACGLKPSKEAVHDGVAVIAHRYKFHPVRDYLHGLQWDGMARLNSWLSYYLAVPPSDWAALIGPKVLISAIARIMKPGCKVDNVLVLEGEQNLGKSTAIAALFGDEWFSDNLPDLHDKDAAIQLQGMWCVEIAELSAVKRSDVETIKSFITRQVDRFRAPYGKVAENHPRQTIFIGTTNRDDYLKDDTGNRRFWPVRCEGTLNIASLRADRDQLWAEAVKRYQDGERWWLEGEENKAAAMEQSQREETDPWEDDVLRYAARARPVIDESIVM